MLSIIVGLKVFIKKYFNVLFYFMHFFFLQGFNTCKYLYSWRIKNILTIDKFKGF